MILNQWSSDALWLISLIQLHLWVCSGWSLGRWSPPDWTKHSDKNKMQLSFNRHLPITHTNPTKLMVMTCTFCICVYAILGAKEVWFWFLEMSCCLKDALHYENKINHSKTHEYIYSALPGQQTLIRPWKKQTYCVHSQGKVLDMVKMFSTAHSMWQRLVLTSRAPFFSWMPTQHVWIGKDLASICKDL